MNHTSRAFERGQAPRRAAQTQRRGRRPAGLLALLPLISLAIAACSGADAPLFKTAAELPDAPRKPDGVAIDPSSGAPSARDQASSNEGIVTLRSPLGVELAMALIADFFGKIVIEDSDGLSALFAKDAIAVTGGSSGGMGGIMGQTPAAGLWWEQRFRRLDYSKLAGEVIYREVDLEIYRANDVPESLPHRAIRTDALHDNDVIIRVSILTPRSGQDRLLGDEIIFWMRRDSDHYKIFRVLEDFQIP